MSNDLSRTKQLLLEQWRRGAVQVSSDAIPMVAGKPTHRARASWAQGELVGYIERHSPGTAQNNICYAGVIESDIDAEAFGQAVYILAKRHETLRTTLVIEDDGVWQIIRDEPQLKLDSTDLSELPPSQAERQAIECANELAATPFDFVAGPLARIALFRLDGARHLIVVIAHHSVADGWSLAVAMREAATIYQAVLDRRELELPDLPFQYRDYVQWQLQWLTTDEAKTHADHWERRLRHTVAPRLPVDTEGVTAAGGAGLARLALTTALTGDVRLFASKRDVSVFTVLLAALGRLLAERTGKPEVSIGIAVANRRPETHQMIGLFSGVVPTQFSMLGQDTFSALVKEARASSATALSHENFPLTLYMGAVEPERDPKDQPFYTAVFVFQPPMQPFTLSGKAFSPVLLDRRAAASQFALHLWDGGEAITGTVGYSTRTLSSTTVDAMIDRFLEILSSGVADPGQSLGEL